MKLEAEADAITRDVMLAVRRTFITPFDRGDIQHLITSMDDAIDQMHQTAKTITLFEVTQFDPRMRNLGDLSIKAAGLTVEAVAALRQMRREATRSRPLPRKWRRSKKHPTSCMIKASNSCSSTIGSQTPCPSSSAARSTAI